MKSVNINKHKQTYSNIIKKTNIDHQGKRKTVIKIHLMRISKNHQPILKHTNQAIKTQTQTTTTIIMKLKIHQW